MNINTSNFLRSHFVQISFWIVCGLVVSIPSTSFAATPSSLVLQAGDYTETLSTEAVSNLMHLDTKMRFIPTSQTEIENPAFCPANKLFCAFSLPLSVSEHLHIATESAPNTEAVKAFVADLSSKVTQDPVDVKFGVADGKVIVAEPEKNGRHLNENDSIDLLVRALENPQDGTIKIALPTEITQPKLVASDRERLGLKELIGEGHTNFAGSPKNRIYNINRALQQFENVIIAPNQEFSFVKYLGEVDGEHGYLPELVIKNNETVPEFGGGICQVSTTVFRAAIYSGLKVTARRNHAYPVRYYTPYGMDATVYIPKPDLTFINNTPGAILMQSTIVGNNLTFRFYGTKDGRTVTIDGPHILESNPDGSMKTVFNQLVTDASGTSIINDSFWSNYKSPSLFPHPGQEPNLTVKPKDWSEKEWVAYKKIHP